MDIIEISNEIQKKIKLLEKSREIIRERANDKAKAISDYDRALALAIVKLRNDKSCYIDGVDVGEKTPTTVMKEIAKGICWREKLELEKAEGLYKSAVSGINSLQAELNGLQSIFRWMDG